MLAGRTVRYSRLLPGMAGAAGVSYGFADRFGAWLGFVIGGLFLLALDFRLPGWSPQPPAPSQEP